MIRTVKRGSIVVLDWEDFVELNPNIVCAYLQGRAPSPLVKL